MKNLPYSFLALIALGVAGRASDTGWSGLDQEIDNLSASLQEKAPTGPKVGGYIMTSLDYEGDPPIAGVDANDDGDFADVGDTAPTEGDDTLGWRFRFVRLEVTGDLGQDYTYKVSFEMSSGTAVIRDAFANWKITDGIQGRWGRYKVPFVRSAMLPDTKMLFLQRTNIANKFATRDLGFQVLGSFDKLAFFVNAQNGTDGVTKDMFYNARLSFDLLGDGMTMQEGAYGAGDALELVVGAAIGDDSGLDDGVRWAADAFMTAGHFAVAAEIADFGADVGDNTPWDATASYLFADNYEAAVRYEDYDTVDDETSYSVGVNRYVAGHTIKWTLQYQRIDTDLESGGIDFDHDQVALGLTVVF